MEKPYMHTIIGSSGKDCVLIKAGIKVIYSGLVSMTTPPSTPLLSQSLYWEKNLSSINVI